MFSEFYVFVCIFFGFSEFLFSGFLLGFFKTFFRWKETVEAFKIIVINNLLNFLVFISRIIFYRVRFADWKILLLTTRCLLESIQMPQSDLD